MPLPSTHIPNPISTPLYTSPTPPLYPARGIPARACCRNDQLLHAADARPPPRSSQEVHCSLSGLLHAADARPSPRSPQEVHRSLSGLLHAADARPPPRSSQE
eukprot:209518-Chlamydomonas_euryale.AAC.1